MQDSNDILKNIFHDNRSIQIYMSSENVTNKLLKLFSIVESCVTLEQLSNAWKIAYNALDQLRYANKTSILVYVYLDAPYKSTMTTNEFFNVIKGYYMAKKFQLLTNTY